MKIFNVDFPMWPVPSCLIIAAENEDQAREIATKTITHTAILGIKEVDISNPTVIIYESGNY